jgi:hypothetical protein
MVWFLSGLLLNAAALLVGFDSSVAFAGLIIGWICCAFGLVLFVLQFQERPTKSAATRLSPDFISAGATVQMAAPKAENQ